MGIDVGYWLIEYELDQMFRYLELVQVALENHGQKIGASYARDMARATTGAEVAILESDYDDIFVEAGRDFPRLLLSSFIISWYSFVEQELLDLCEELKLSISIRPKENEYFDKGIRRARKFLSKAKDYEIDSSHWQELVNIGKLRNQIVHTGNRIYCSYNKLEGKFVSYTREDGDIYIDLDKSLFDYLQKHNLIELKGPPYVEVMPTHDYCQHLVEFGKNLFYKLHSDLKPSAQIFRRDHA